MPGQPEIQRDMMRFEVLYAQPPVNQRVFVGPKDFDVLESVDRDLVGSVHYGIFSFLAVPLLRSLKWIDGFVGNYGWSIIILTILINIAMFPLKHKSVVSMRKMQELQPQVKAIQDRLLEDEDDRSWPVEDERRAHGALQREGREPGQRMRADAADDAGAVCVLLDVVGGCRDSW